MRSRPEAIVVDRMLHVDRGYAQPIRNPGCTVVRGDQTRVKKKSVGDQTNANKSDLALERKATFHVQARLQAHLFSVHIILITVVDGYSF